MDLLNMTIGEYLKRTARQFPSEIAVIQFKEDKILSWEEVDSLSDDYAKGFLALGLKKGDKLAIWATNRIEWVLCFLAAAKIGIIVATVNINYKKEEVKSLLSNTEINALVFMDGFRECNYLQIIKEIKEKSKKDLSLSHLKYFIHFGEKNCNQAIELSEILKMRSKVTDYTLKQSMDAVRPDDTINIQFTSGTTNKQKGVMLTHYNLVNNSFFSGERLDLNHQDRLCLAVPFFHCFGLSAGILMCIGKGVTMVLVECYRSVQVMQAISELRCTVLHGVPTMFSKIMEHREFQNYQYDSLRTGIVAGANCSEKLLKNIIEKMGIKEITVAYGQTETSPCCTQTYCTDTFEKKAMTVGRPIPYVEMKVVHLKTKETCLVGETGEICTRGYHLMKGYYNAPDLTEKTIDEEGWLHTGDIGFIDDKGYYHVCGRLKDTIIRGGENISPQEIEQVLLKHPYIMEAYVFGVVDKCYGEEIAASIKVMSEKKLTIEEIKNFLKEHLALYKVPKYIQFCETFPMTSSGKVIKNLLRQRMIDTVKAL